MKKKVKTILELMEQLGVTIGDLQVYDDSIETTKKFPLEVYFSDRTKSYDVDYYYKSVHRTAVGIMINNTVYALADYAESVECGHSENYCRKAFHNGLIGSLPLSKQIVDLSNNLIAYNRISVFLKHGKLGGESRLAIADKGNSSRWQAYYNMERGIEAAHNSWTKTLPVINL